MTWTLLAEIPVNSLACLSSEEARSYPSGVQEQFGPSLSWFGVLSDIRAIYDY